MDRYSICCDGKVVFGGFPTQEEVDYLEENGVVIFVDLTRYFEKGVKQYSTTGKYIKYPIRDHNIPYDPSSFNTFINSIVSNIQSLQNGKKIYIHCKGGHGRSSLVISCLLCKLKRCSALEAIGKTYKYHNKRVMKQKWKRGPKSTRLQRSFIDTFYNYIFCGGFQHTWNNSVKNETPPIKCA